MRRRTTRSGFTLVQALVVVAGLMALMAAMAAEQRINLNATQDRLRQRRAEAAAHSALSVATATLDAADPNLVTLADDWATLGDNGTQVFTIGDTGDVTYRLQILDAGSRVNVNTATETQLQTLPLTPEQTDSLLDWREDSTQARPEGAKDDYYNTLAEPYNTRLGNLTTLSELLLIKGWTARGLYFPLDGSVSTAPIPISTDGTPLPLIDVLTVQSGMPNTRADGSARINLARGVTNEAALSRLGLSDAVTEEIVRGRYTSWSDLLLLPGLTQDNAGRLLDEFTFTAGTRLEGKININTVPQAVLENLFTLPPDVASSIVSRQDAGFSSLGDLATVPGMTPSQLATIADFVGVGSDTWIVRAYGESGGVGVAIEATIGRRNDRTRILSFDRMNGSQVPTWWNWPAAEDTTAAPAASGVTP